MIQTALVEATEWPFPQKKIVTLCHFGIVSTPRCVSVPVTSAHTSYCSINDMWLFRTPLMNRTVCKSHLWMHISLVTTLFSAVILL